MRKCFFLLCFNYMDPFHRSSASRQKGKIEPSGSPLIISIPYIVQYIILKQILPNMINQIHDCKIKSLDFRYVLHKDGQVSMNQAELITFYSFSKFTLDIHSLQAYLGLNQIVLFAKPFKHIKQDSFIRFKKKLLT